MRKRILTILALLTGLCLPVFTFAETIILKSGKIVEGKLIEKTDKYIKVDFQGVPLVYYLDEIESIKGESYQPIPRGKGNVVPSQPEKNPQSENKSIERQRVLEYLDKSDSIIKSSNIEIAKKQDSLVQASKVRDMEKMRVITMGMRDIYSQQKEVFLLLPVPPNLEPLHTVTLKWFQLQEDMHNELINGNIGQAKLLSQQLIEAWGLMGKEGDRLIKSYE